MKIFYNSYHFSLLTSHFKRLTYCGFGHFPSKCSYSIFIENNRSY